MPKETKQRIIDFRPPKFVVRQQRKATTTVPVPVAPTITIIDTGGGSGGDGDSNTHTIDGTLQDGDVYVVAYAGEYGGYGYPSVSPKDYLLDGPTIGRIACARVGYGQGGGNSYTVTIHDGACAYRVWILRGVATAYSTPAIVYAYDQALITYTGASLPNLDPCANELTRTDVYGPAVVAAPRSGSQAFFAGWARGSICVPGAPTVTIDGGSSVASGNLGASTGYNFGTIANGGGTVAVDTTVGYHGANAMVDVISIAPMAV